MEEVQPSEVNSIDVLLKGDQSTSFSVLLKNAGPVVAEEDVSKVLKYANSQTGSGSDYIYKVVVDRNREGNIKNLIFYLQNTAQNINTPFAIILEPIERQAGVKSDTGGGGFGAVGSHSCSGDPCGCCDFLKDDNGNIVGCDCKGGIWSSDVCSIQTGQKCNHTISQ